MTYASRTKIPIAKSRADVEKLIDKYGAGDFAYQTRPTGASVMFTINERIIRMELIYGDAEKVDRPTQETQHRKELWRAFVAIIKAKFLSVESNVTTIEEEFLAYTVVPGTDQTVAQWIGESMPALKTAQRQLTGSVN